MMQHAVVAIRIGEERHVTHACIEDLAGKHNAPFFELRPLCGNVLDVEGDVAVLLRRPLPADPLRLP